MGSASAGIGAATLLALVIAAIGHPVIGLTVGPAYQAAYVVMVLLVVARTIGVFPWALGQALIAMGAPGLVLAIEVANALVFIPALFLLLYWIGLNGAGVAALAVAVPATAAVTLAALHRLRRFERPHGSEQPPARR